MAAAPNAKAGKLAAIAPQFPVSDVRKSAEWYRDRLEFEIGPYFEEPPVFVILSRDGTRLMLSLAEGSRGDQVSRTRYPSARSIIAAT
ncbi:MAG: hypothetical protein ACREQF_10755 [Candidatus Binataceae bacterium]